jgi:membrane-bound lytic murein transglycosylase D
MVRAQRQWGDYPNIYRNHKTRLFKFASKNFYSEFLAAVRIARLLENDPALIKDRPWASATVRLKKYAAVKDLCSYFGVSRKDFARMNPALRDPVINGRKYIPKGFLVRLPATKRIRQLIKIIPNRLFHNSQVRDRLYRVKKGDTAASIARRHNISLKQLIRANHLNKKATIRIGQKLKIPSKGSAVSGRTHSRIIILKQTAKRKP